MSTMYEHTFNNSKVDIVVNSGDTVIADVHPNKDSWWGVCRLVFTGKYIMCCGDVNSYTLDCTWNTAESIRNGNEFSEYYLLGKLAHSQDLKEFDNYRFEEAIAEMKEYVTGTHYSDEPKEYKERWEENEYLLENVGENRLSPFDEFCDEVGIEDGYEWISRFYEYPAHAYAFIKLINVVGKHFRDERSK